MALEIALRSLVLLLAAPAAVRLCGRSPALRHLVWSLTLVGLLLLPGITAFLPAVPVPVLPGREDLAATVVGTPLPASGPEELRTPRTLSAGAPESRLRTQSIAPQPLTVLWLGGTFFFLGRTVWIRWRLARLGRRSRPPSPALVREVEELARRAGLRRRMRLVESVEVDVPSTWGVLLPVLAVPSGFRTWGAGRRRRILVHELAHVRRCDGAWALVSETATSLFWWNPLAWHAARRARDESERAADAHVLAAGTRPSDYAEDLLAVARSLSAAPWMRALPGIGRGRLGRRIEGVLNPAGPCLPGRRAAVVTGLLAVGGIAAVTTVLPVEATAPVGSPRAGSGEGAPAGAAVPPWPAHQVRWAYRGEAGGLFLEGDVELTRLLRRGEPPAPDVPSLLVWFHRGADGTWTSFASGRTGGVPWTTGRSGTSRNPEASLQALRRRLRDVAPDWRDHPDTSIGALASLPELAGRPPLGFSGSVILGVPGSSRDPGTGVLQAGWYSGTERIGVFARGPLELGSDGRSLERLPGDGWLAAFGWTASTERLRIVEALPGRDGRPSFLYTEDGVEHPFDGAARAWLGRVLAELPDADAGRARVSWRG